MDGLHIEKVEKLLQSLWHNLKEVFMKVSYKFFLKSIGSVFKLSQGFILLVFLSCTSMEEMPKVVSIFRGEIENVKLANYVQEKIILHFLLIKTSKK